MMEGLMNRVDTTYEKRYARVQSIRLILLIIVRYPILFLRVTVGRYMYTISDIQ